MKNSRFLAIKLWCLIVLVSACHKSNSNVVTNNSDTTSPKQFYAVKDFVMGVDLSMVNEVEDNGGKFYDSSIQKDVFAICKNHGANLVRVRLWNNPSWQDTLKNGKRYSDIADVEKTISRAKAAGMAVNLDFHYSDIWADPNTQTIPSAWAGLPLTKLKDSIYNYTLWVLNELKSKQLTPYMVQIGNETNQGMLWPTGKITNNDFSAFSSLLQSGIKALRDFSTSSPIKPLILLHVAQLQNADWFADGVINKGGVTDFDILGISHYVDYTSISSMTAVTSAISSLTSKYHKEIMLAEFSYPWTTANADSYPNIATKSFANYPLTKQGQFDYIKDLTQAVIKGGGKGVMYWEPAWITSKMKDLWGIGSSWDNNTLFDFQGNALPAINFMNAKYQF